MSTDQVLARLKLNHPGLYEKLGKVTDVEIGNEYGITRSRVHQLRKRFGIEKVPLLPLDVQEEIKSKLGVEPDNSIAKTYGVGVGTVRALRNSLQIQSVSRRKFDSIIAGYADELGEISDATIAKKAGVHTSAVFQYRQRNGIPSKVYSPRNKNFVPVSAAEVLRLFNEGKTDLEIAHVLNITKGYVTTIRQRNGWLRARSRKVSVAP